MYEATIKDPYSWSKRIIQLTTQQVTSKIPTHVYSKEYQMSKAQTALDAVRSTRPWVLSATQNFYYRITQILKKEMIQPVHTLYSKASDERERIPFYVASAKYLREYFQNALNQARKNMANFSNTEIYHTSPYDMFSKKLEYDFDKVACLPPEERNIYYGEWANQAIESFKVIDEYMEFGGIYHVVQNGRIIREYYENGTQKFEEVSYIPENRIGGSRELGSAFEGTPIWYVDYFSTGTAIKNTFKKLGKNAFSGFNKGIDNAKLSPSNYPNPDPPMSIPLVRYEPKTIEEVIRMRQGKGPTTKITHGDKNIEAHHRQQVPVKKGGKLDELEQRTHRGGGNHTRHDKPSRLTPYQRAKEIREHYIERGKEYILPREGI
ncbi:hypothetical protein [Bacillus alkalicellulosilyticus]|uniref:hypothetical protein n=1 Tax=Alkalihalobacterium alkalicellulosilyticum TaxID=1912214 RepID=UPI001FE2889F|nr:hypothetical protein [Bacillus alkalicellulosilyticus]